MQFIACNKLHIHVTTVLPVSRYGLGLPGSMIRIATKT